MPFSANHGLNLRLLELARRYDEPIEVQVPEIHAREASLPGALDAWNAGVEEERRRALRVLWSPRDRGSNAPTLDMVMLRAALERALDDASELNARFQRSPVLGRRLELLARAEMASLFARHLGDIATEARPD